MAYFNLGNALNQSGHNVEAAQRYLEARERRETDGLGALGTGHGNGLRPAKAEGVRRGGQPGVVERRGAQGVVGEGYEGGAGRWDGQPNAGLGAERGVWRLLGEWASLDNGAQEGGHAL